MKQIIVACGLVCVLAVPAWATNGYQLIGVGQAQKGMGGAVTAAPMDSMTAITNPAGMARVGNRADFSMEAFMPERSVSFGSTGGTVEAQGGSELYGIPSVGWVAHAFGRDNFFFGGGMFATSGLGVDYGESTIMPAGALGVGTPAVTFDGFSAIEFWKMAPTVAWNADDATSFGISANLDYQSLTIRQKFGNMPFNTLTPGVFNQTDVNFDLGRPTTQLGFGATFGVLRDLNHTVTVGASYSTKQYFGDGEYRVGTGDVSGYNGATGLPGVYKLDLDYPQQAAVGIAVHPTATLLVDVDVKWIDWSSTHNKVSLTGPAGSFMGPSGATDHTVLDFGWEDQIVFAVGVQWRATKATTLRIGYNYAEAPIDEADVMNNLVLPALVEHHLGVGAEYQLDAHWGIGATVMKAFKHDLRGVNDVPAGFQATTPFTADSGFEISLEETTVGLLLSYQM